MGNKVFNYGANMKTGFHLQVGDIKYIEGTVYNCIKFRIYISILQFTTLLFLLLFVVVVGDCQDKNKRVTKCQKSKSNSLRAS